MLAAAKTTGAEAVSGAVVGAVSAPSTLRVNATAPIARPSIRELSTRRVSIVKSVPLVLFVNSEPYIGAAPHDSPHFQMAPKVSAKSGSSASIVANRSIKGSNRNSGMVGINS